MNLEEIRDSLLQKLKDAEDLHQKKELEDILLNLSIKVTYLRAIIISYGKSGKRCEMIVKELLEKKCQEPLITIKSLTLQI